MKVEGHAVFMCEWPSEVRSVLAQLPPGTSALLKPGTLWMTRVRVPGRFCKELTGDKAMDANALAIRQSLCVFSCWVSPTPLKQGSCFFIRADEERWTLMDIWGICRVDRKFSDNSGPLPSRCIPHSLMPVTPRHLPSRCYLCAERRMATMTAVHTRTNPTFQAVEHISMIWIVDPACPYHWY